MHLTVEEALSIYPLTEARLIAGSKGKQRIVKSINVMDAPDISDWIKEGEMLLTTAYLIKDNPEKASALLQTLNRRGSAGLGIKLGRFWNTVPEALIEEADTLGFPLIELPFRFTFSDQMNGLFRAELTRNTGLLQTMMAKQRELMRFALQPGRSRSLLDSISGVIGYPMAVVGTRGDVVYNNSEYTASELLEGWPWLPRNQRCRVRDQAAFRIPLQPERVSSSYLIYTAIDPLLLAAEEDLFVQGAELITFHIHSGGEEYFEQAEHKEFAALLRRCLKGDLACGDMERAAAKLGIGLLQSAFQLLLTDTPASGESRRTELLRLKAEYMEQPELRELNAIHIILEEGLLSLYPAGEYSVERFRELVEGFLSPLQIGTDCVPRAVISGVKTKAEGLKEAFAEVRECIGMMQHWWMQGQVVHYRQLEPDLLLAQIPAEKMKKYCESNLRGLLDREPEYVKEMLRTLEVYLESDGHVAETAKKLFIHRNTATYRIEKLSELLGVDFKKINDLMRLKLVFMFRRLLERNE